MEPDFSKYNLEELQEIKEALDKDKYPEKYSRLLDAIAKHPSSPIQAKTQESDYALRSLFKEYKKEKYHIWKLFRGVLVMFISFRVMQYFEWSTNQQIVGAVLILIAYASILIAINEYQFKKFKDGFEKRT